MKKSNIYCIPLTLQTRKLFSKEYLLALIFTIIKLTIFPGILTLNVAEPKFTQDCLVLKVHVFFTVISFSNIICNSETIKIIFVNLN